MSFENCLLHLLFKTVMLIIWDKSTYFFKSMSAKIMKDHMFDDAKIIFHIRLHLSFKSHRSLREVYTKVEKKISELHYYKWNLLWNDFSGKFLNLWFRWPLVFEGTFHTFLYRPIWKNIWARNSCAWCSTYGIFCQIV